jgi:hypothetical protein
MTRAISVLGAVVVLLAVGWYFGHRPVSRLERTLLQEQEACADQAQELQAQARMAEARGYLWTVEGELILAAQDVESRNFGTASSRVTRARDLLGAATDALAPGAEMEPVREGVLSALERIDALDPAAGEVLLRTAAALNRLLESVGSA